MSEVVVVGSFKSQPGKEGEAVEAVRALVEPTHGEQGCILYALHRGVDDPSGLAFRSAGRRERSSTPTCRARTCRSS
jgi:quinol monooxygenase YgiN